MSHQKLDKQQRARESDVVKERERERERQEK